MREDIREMVTENIARTIEQHIKPIFINSPKCSVLIRHEGDTEGLYDVLVSDDTDDGIRALIARRCPVDEKAERALFEEAIYHHYLQRKAAGKLRHDGDGDGSREALCWKQPDGSYGVLANNAAWWGWKAAKGLL